MKKVTIYTDGACRGNPGPGGWGAILMFNGVAKELSGGQRATTNNQMELWGVIEALNALKEPCTIDLYTDSKYVQQGITEWIHNWIQKNWRNANRKPVKNVDLWKQLLAAKERHQVRFHWVKGHEDNPYNNRCDELAREAIPAD